MIKQQSIVIFLGGMTAGVLLMLALVQAMDCLLPPTADVPSGIRAVGPNQHDALEDRTGAPLFGASGPAPMGFTEELEKARQEIDDLRQENRVSTLRHTKLTHQHEDLLNWILRNYSGKFPLPEEQLHKLKLQPLDEAYGLHEDLESFLHITDDEKKAISDTFIYTRAVMDAIEMERMEITFLTPQHAVLTIPPYPEEGARIQASLLANLEAALGKDRYAWFYDVSNEALEKGFHFFGRATRTLTFEVDYPDEQESPIITINDGWIREDGEKWIVHAEEVQVAKPAEEYISFLSALPDSFWEAIR